jgi:hypothetical protein
MNALSGNSESQLNDAQRRVLHWIAEGCPPGYFDGYAHRVTAAALRSRGLVRTWGRSSRWQAEITEAGSDLLRAPPDTTATEASEPSDPAPSSPSRLSKTEQLVQDLVEAGGVLRLPLRYGPHGPTVRQRAYAAQDAGKLPAGKRLTTVTMGDDIEIRLIDASAGLDYERAELVPVAVPQRISKYHAATRGFRDRSERHEVSRSVLPRATRITEAMAREAERRGWSAECPPTPTNTYGRSEWTATKYGHLQIVADGHRYWFRLQEEGVHTRGPWEEQQRWYGRPRPAGRYDAEGTGRLTLRLHTEFWWRTTERRSNWSDRQAWTLEERLPHVFREIEGRIVETARVDEERRLAEERAEEERRLAREAREQQWHLHMENAKRQATEDWRAQNLKRQARAWAEAAELRAQCDAMEASHGANVETQQWLRWARQYADTVDPLMHPPTAPEDRDSTEEVLAKYMPSGWTPRGPHEPSGTILAVVAPTTRDAKMSRSPD